MAAVDEAAVWRTREACQPFRDGARLQAVVGIEKNHIACTQCHQAGIPRRGESAVVLANTADTGETRYDLPRIVIGAVIHDHDRVGRARLRAHAFQRFAQKMSVVVGRDDDTCREGRYRFRAA